MFQNNCDIAVSCYFHSYAILVVKEIVTSTNFSWVGLGVTYGHSKAHWVSYEHCAAASNTAYGHYILCHGFRLGKIFDYDIVL